MKKNTGQKIFLGFVFVYLFVPVIATIIYSLATKWDSTILPEGYTLQFYAALFSDKRFLLSLLKTMNISLLTAIVSVIVLLLVIILKKVHYHRMHSVFIK
jgi:putative spermidine/putrescine transport system permease protein